MKFSNTLIQCTLKEICLGVVPPTYAISLKSQVNPRSRDALFLAFQLHFLFLIWLKPMKKSVKGGLVITRARNLHKQLNT
jgi:hypothetical protein